MGSGMIHLRREDYVTSRWSGGSTTQIAIAPEGALYADRSFLWRLSSATVELEESDFTPLPDYNRLISTLKGEIDLVHDGGAPLHLKPYQIHAFDGGAATVSRGVCTDFNLMLRKGACTGELKALHLGGAPAVLRCDAGEAWTTLLVYCCTGAATAVAGGEELTLQAGESLLVRDAAGVELRLEGAADCMAAQIHGCA